MTEKVHPVSVKDIIPDVLKSISRRDIQDQVSLEKLWQDVLGDDVDRATITGFKDGCVLANVESPTFLFKMRMRRQEIVRRMKEKRNDITDVIFRIGRIT